MAEAQAKAPEDTKAPETNKAPEKAKVSRLIQPVLSKNFQLQQSAFNIHNAVLPADTTKAELLDTRWWNHVSSKILKFDEIRVVEANGAFVAGLLVTFKHGSDVRVKILEFHELEEIDYEEAAGLKDYLVKNRGAVGWCVVDAKSGKNLFTNLESQAAALTKREEYVATLRKR